MNELEYHLRRFGRRLRLREMWVLFQTTFWIPALCAVVIQIAGRVFPIPNLWIWTLSALAIWALMAVMVPIIKPKPLERIAKDVDRELGLKERLSTAWILQNDIFHFEKMLVKAQRRDALARASSIVTTQAFPFRWIKKPLIFGFCLLLFAAASEFLPNSMDLRLKEKAALQEEAREQAARVEELKEEITESQELSPENREELVRELEELAEALRTNPGDLEQALADLSKFEESVEERLDPNLSTKQALLNAMSTQLSQINGDDVDPETSESAQEALDKLLEELEKLDENEREKLARNLAQMGAQAIQAGDPQLGQALSSLAQAVQNGQAQDLQQAARSAQSALANLENQIADQTTLQQALAQSQASQQALSQTGRQLAQAQRQPGAQGNSSIPGQGQGGQPGQGGGSNASKLPPFRGGKVDVRPQGQAPDAQTGAFDTQVYSPWQRSASNGEQVFIPGQDTGEGETTTTESQNPQPGMNNPALMPYSQVYFQYLSAANQAMQQSYIPANLMEYVRLYFSSLEP
jgi:chemotaxis protein histidine kinase CheA